MRSSQQAYRENFASVFDPSNPRNIAYNQARADEDAAKLEARLLAPRPARSNLPCPMVVNDSLPDGTYSGADGQIYTSKAALRASYLPSGNPDGIRYEEVGNEKINADPVWKKSLSDKKIDESIGKAAARLGVDL